MNDSNAVRRRLGVVLSLVYTIVGILAGFLFTPICTRMLGKSEYGVYSLVFSLVGYLGLFDLGFGTALIRYSARLREEGKDPKDLYGMFLKLYLAIGTVVLALGLIVWWAMPRFFSAKLTGEEIGLLRAMFLLMLVNTALSFPGNVFSSIVQAYEEFVFSRLLNIAGTILPPLIGTAALFMGHGALGLIQINVAVSILTYAANVVFCFRKLKIRIGFRGIPASFAREIFGFSLFIFLDLLVGQIYDGTDQILLARLCSAAAVAVYSVGVKFELYYQYLAASIANIYLPHISALAAREDGLQEMDRILKQVGRFQLLMLAFVLCGFTVYGREFMTLWAGEDYADGYWIALLIMVPTLVIQAQTIGPAILKALNLHRIRSIMMMVIAVFNIAISIPLSVWFGGIGAAAGTCIGYFIGQIGFMNWYYYKKVGLDIPGWWRMAAGELLKMLPVLAPFSLTGVLIHSQGWLWLIVKIASGVALTLPYLYFAVLHSDEREAAARVLEKLFGRK